MEEYYNIVGNDNYIDLPDIDLNFPVNITVKIPKDSNYTTIHPIISNGKQELKYGRIKKYINDEEYHHIKWDGENVWIDGKFCKP